jgi:hypothetical protein
LPSVLARCGHQLDTIGNSRPEPLLNLAETLAGVLDVTAIREFKPMQPGDVPAAFADVSAMERDFGWRPATDLRAGLTRFVQWWRSHRKEQPKPAAGPRAPDQGGIPGLRQTHGPADDPTQRDTLRRS